METLTGTLVTLGIGIISWFLNDKFSNMHKQLDGFESKFDAEKKIADEFRNHLNTRIEKLSDYVSDSQTLIVELQHKMNQELLEIHKEVLELGSDDERDDEMKDVRHSLNNLKQATSMIYNSVKEMRAAQDSHFKDNIIHLKKNG